MSDTVSIVLAGVGGHGVITAATILGKAAVKAKIPVFTSEVHGMAQRGGTVLCTVRMGKVSSPLLPSGSADGILGMEPIEALRYITYANKKTQVVTDVNPVIPFTVSVGDETYPDLADVFREIKAHAGVLYMVDAVKLAKEAGAIVTKNTVMLGALAATGVLPFKPDVLIETVLENVPAKYTDANKKAFFSGMKAVEKAYTGVFC